jgi:cellulose synthase/poly-beta-1,6-N-acetylglucosamine synthase-like glycosyltransferase
LTKGEERKEKGNMILVNRMISIIIPAFNSEHSIESCLHSLKKQSYKKPYEIIVVDDGSTDKTPDKVNEIGGILLFKQSNSGPAKARNLGAKNARGNILLFTDSDCIADKDWVNEMLMPFIKKDVVGVQGRYKTKQKTIIPTFIQMEIEQRYDKIEKNKHIDFIGSYSAAYRRDIFLKFGGFDESFRAASGEDPELSFRIADAGHKMVFNSKAIVYHTHPTSLSKYLKSRFHRGYWGRLLYKKHPARKSRGSDKGKSYFIGIGLTCILTLILLFSYISESIIFGDFFVSILAFILLLSTAVYESLYFIAKNKRLIFAIPFIIILILLRNIAIGTGIASGMIRLR